MDGLGRAPVVTRGLVASAVLAAVGAVLVAWSGPPGLDADTASRPLPASITTDTVFRHAQHEAVDCVRCHAATGPHGSLLVRTVEDCRACHHVPPVSEPCSTCHAAVEASRDRYELPRTLTVAGETIGPRPLPFDHASHPDLACATCHVGEPVASGTNVDCTSCHVDHHLGGTECRTCHVQAPEDVHPLAVHAGCGGAGCHSDPVLVDIPDSRAFCEVCHQDLIDHKTGQECTACHLLPVRRG